MKSEKTRAQSGSGYAVHGPPNDGQQSVSEQQILGRNLKRIRKARGIPLQRVADNVGVSKSFLSQIENGKAVPSLSKLKEIVNFLNTSISTLLEEQDHHEKPVLREQHRKELMYQNGIAMALLTHPEPYKQIQPMFFRLKPGASSGTKPYQHFGQEFVYVVDGELEICLQGTSHILYSGDSIYFPSSTPHSFRNPSEDEETEALWVDTPPTF